MHDWSKFSKRISINASKEEIFSYWENQVAIEKWFLRSAVFSNSNKETKSPNEAIAEGDTYTWMWHGSDSIVNGEVYKVKSPDIISFSFLGCKVDVTLRTEDEESLIELQQSEIPLDEDSRVSLYVGCSRGWTFYLTNLKSIIEGGVDLRNRNINLKNMINT